MKIPNATNGNAFAYSRITIALIEALAMPITRPNGLRFQIENAANSCTMPISRMIQPHVLRLSKST